MTLSALVEDVVAGRMPAVARMISRVERRTEGVTEQMAELYPLSGRAHVVGITGAPGSGKSTLVQQIAAEHRRRGRTVGIVAVDPSSPFSGGSIMGDRIRMGALAGDPGVFIRSMATRGTLGGLARATADAVTVLDAAGKDMVLIETVGVGQDEVEIVRASHTTVVVSVPGLGDDVQAIKAGVLEIADIHVVNKADREGADRVRAQLRDMLRMVMPTDTAAWEVPVHPTVAQRGDGVPQLSDLLDAHRSWLADSGKMAHRERQMAATRILAVMDDLVRQRLVDPHGEDFDQIVDEVARRKLNPVSAATTLLDANVGRDRR